MKTYPHQLALTPGSVARGVLRLPGSKSISNRMLLLAALAEAQGHGVAVRLTTRCAEGQIVGQTAALQTAPGGLNAYKARVSLMLDLMK